MRTRPLVILGVLVLTAAVLRLAQAVLMPFALAVMLTFLLSPVVIALQRRIGRAAAVFVVVVFAFSVLVGVGWAISGQLATLADDLPKYRASIRQKVIRLRQSGEGGVIGGVRKTVREIAGEIEREERPTGVPRPTPVVVQGVARPVLDQISAITAPLASIGLVFVLLIFMLFEREQLRNRLIRLLGYRRLTGTTKALDEAAERISRYLMTQSLLNATFGLAFGAGLWLIGVPYGLLWGFLAAVLRFIPYVGIWIAVAFPFLLTLAVFDGWRQLLLVVALFVGIEVVMSVGIEPVLYSQRAGVSKVALLTSVAFWTWMWGPVGLALATPLTVCLVVLAKHFAELEFITILMADEPVLEVSVRYYQRLLAADDDEAAQIVDEYVKTHGVESVYDDVLIPALNYARRDREEDQLTDDDDRFIVGTTRKVVEELEPLARAAFGAPAAAGVRLRILGCPVRDEMDELALMMLGQLLDPRRFELTISSPELLSSEVVSLVEHQSETLICAAALPPGGLAQTRYLCKRLRARLPEIKIVVGRWGFKGAVHESSGALREACAEHVGTTLLETRRQLYQLLPLVRSSERAA